MTHPVDLDEIRANARQGETFPDWTLAMADELEILRHRLADRAFDREDRTHTRLLIFIGGAAFGVALAAIAVWAAS